MATPTLDRFLREISALLQASDAMRLSQFLLLEPPYGREYLAIINELRQVFPKGRDAGLDDRCASFIPWIQDMIDGAPAWTAFNRVLVQYLRFLRDNDATNLLETYNALSEVLQRCNSALTHQTMGVLMLPTVIQYAKLLSRLAIGLDKQPELIAHLVAKPAGDDGEARESLPERAADILRNAFVTCLNDRTSRRSGLDDVGQPEGKKRGIYLLANLCLKILFQCRKTRNASQIFANIYKDSPPLPAYPRGERVTYLYYLGRFMFQNNHFQRAQLCLQAAYDQAHASPQAIRHRRLILVYLITSNIILARFPSAALFQRAEAAGLAARFIPLCHALKTGNLFAFHRHLDAAGAHADFFLHYRILLQLRNRCEVLVWRSLVRSVFLAVGSIGDPHTRVAPSLSLADITHALAWGQKRELATQPNSGFYIDPDFAHLPPEYDEPEGYLVPDLLDAESVLASLIDQGLLNGYISKKQMKFAIVGAKKQGALAAGFPIPWTILGKKGDGEVPGWKVRADVEGAGVPGPGQIVRLAGVKAIGET